MKTLVLVRHGESEWNAEDRFTGWMDVELTPKGREEARHAGALLRDYGLRFRFAYTSVLTRAIDTLHLIQAEMGCSWMAEYKDWRLNEKHYGVLQGRNKTETAREFGDYQVHRWRRAYDCPPPPLEEGDPRSSAADPRYAHLEKGWIPRTESLKDTRERVEHCWRMQISPALYLDPHVLVVAHGNSLRALMMLLQDLSPEQVERLEIPTGRPLLVEWDDALHLSSVRYIGTPATASP